MKTSTIPTLLGPDGMTSLREYAGYHGGGSGFGGQLRAWNPPGESVDAALLPNFTRGNARADDLVRNNGYAANAIQLHQDHIVGSFFRLSHRPSWRYLGIGEEEARAFSREVESAWKEFAEDDCCCIDVERKRTFTMMIREGVAMHAFNRRIPGAFIQQLKNGRWHVMQRVAGKNRYPIDVVKIPMAVPLTTAFKQNIERIRRERLPKELGYALQHQLRMVIKR